MPERQPKLRHQMIERGRDLLQRSKDSAETAALYIAALSATPALLLASLRIRNPHRLDIELETLSRPDSGHEAFMEGGNANGYVPKGATVSLKGLDRPVLIKEMRWGSLIFVGKPDDEIQPINGHGGGRFFLKTDSVTNVNALKPNGGIPGTPLFVNYIDETPAEIEERYPKHKDS